MLNKILSVISAFSPAARERAAERQLNTRKIKSVFRDPPVLETERVILRKILRSDSYDMHTYACREDVTRYLTWYPHKSFEETREYIDYITRRYAEGKFFDWGLEYKADRRFIGTCGFTSININQNKAEVGYVLSPLYWGRRIMPEVLRAVIDFGFETFGFNKIEARYIDGNEKSANVMKSCGMKYESTEYKGLFIKGEYKTVHTYAVTKEDFYEGIKN